MLFAVSFSVRAVVIGVPFFQSSRKSAPASVTLQETAHGEKVLVCLCAKLTGENVLYLIKKLLIVEQVASLSVMNVAHLGM